MGEGEGERARRSREVRAENGSGRRGRRRSWEALVGLGTSLVLRDWCRLLPSVGQLGCVGRVPRLGSREYYRTVLYRYEMFLPVRLASELDHARSPIPGECRRATEAQKRHCSWYCTSALHVENGTKLGICTSLRPAFPRLFAPSDDRLNINHLAAFISSLRACVIWKPTTLDLGKRVVLHSRRPTEQPQPSISVQSARQLHVARCWHHFQQLRPSRGCATFKVTTHYPHEIIDGRQLSPSGPSWAYSIHHTCSTGVIHLICHRVLDLFAVRVLND